MADAPRRLPAFLMGCLLTAGLAVALAAGGVWWLRPAPAAEPPARSRSEFTRLVMGKPAVEVLAAVGPPDSTSEDAQARYWHYKRRTRDPLTDAPDTDVQVVLEGETVTAINY